MGFPFRGEVYELNRKLYTWIKSFESFDLRWSESYTGNIWCQYLDGPSLSRTLRKTFKLLPEGGRHSFMKWMLVPQWSRFVKPIWWYLKWGHRERVCIGIGHRNGSLTVGLVATGRGGHSSLSFTLLFTPQSLHRGKATLG